MAFLGLDELASVKARVCGSLVIVSFDTSAGRLLSVTQAGRQAAQGIPSVSLSTKVAMALRLCQGPGLSPAWPSLLLFLARFSLLLLLPWLE